VPVLPTHGWCPHSAVNGKHVISIDEVGNIRDDYRTRLLNSPHQAHVEFAIKNVIGGDQTMESVTETIRRTAIFLAGLGGLSGAFMIAMRLAG
jgi:hypothetical protein